MTRRILAAGTATMIAWTVCGGCQPSREFYPFNENVVVHYKQAATQISYPDAENPRLAEVEDSMAPRTLAEPEAREYWNLPLTEAIQVALANSRVMRDLGGRVISTPQALNTVYEPSITESDPRFGVEAALSAFDAQFATDAIFERNDRPVNQVVPGFTLPVFQQDLAAINAQISKTNATGGTWTLRNVTNYDANNNPNNRFPSVWENNVEAEFRQPLLQGAGIEFNRIAGPAASPGFFFSNGVLIARVNTDIALADFEAGVRRLVSDVENAYWDLYFAYRDLDAKVAARDAALATWRRTYALTESGQAGGGAAAEAQAREQYFLFRAQVENALSGTPGGSTQSGSGTSAGLFQGAGGVYTREANLRFLMGLATNDGRLIRPADEPLSARVQFVWDEVLTEALCRRVELRRQRWLIKRRELELIASKNFLLPRLDALGRYRFRGFGDDLWDANGNNPPFDNAFETLTDGDFQEWQVGLQFSVAIGQRQAHAAVRNAELQLARERSVLQDQELSVQHGLADALRELERAYALIDTNYQRRVAALKAFEANQAEYEAGRVDIDVVLDTQRRLADAETAYFRSLVEYTLALKSVHFEKGSLLDYNNVQLAEGLWPDKAYADAKKRAHRRLAADKLDYGFTLPGPISRGIYLQQGDHQAVLAEHDGRALQPTPAETIPAPQPVPRDPNEEPLTQIDSPAVGPVVTVANEEPQVDEPGSRANDKVPEAPLPADFDPQQDGPMTSGSNEAGEPAPLVPEEFQVGGPKPQPLLPPSPLGGPLLLGPSGTQLSEPQPRVGPIAPLRPTAAPALKPLPTGETNLPSAANAGPSVGTVREQAAGNSGWSAVEPKRAFEAEQPARTSARGLHDPTQSTRPSDGHAAGWQRIQR